jgi:hypothetical protein
LIFIFRDFELSIRDRRDSDPGPAPKLDHVDGPLTSSTANLRRGTDLSLNRKDKKNKEDDKKEKDDSNSKRKLSVTLRFKKANKSLYDIFKELKKSPTTPRKAGSQTEETMNT